MAIFPLPDRKFAAHPPVVFHNVPASEEIDSGGFDAHHCLPTTTTRLHYAPYQVLPIFYKLRISLA